MAGKVCLLSVYMLDACEDGWGNHLIAVLELTVLQLSCTHLWANNIHPLLNYVGTTGKGYNTTQLYFIFVGCLVRGEELQLCQYLPKGRTRFELT